MVAFQLLVMDVSMFFIQKFQIFYPKKMSNFFVPSKISCYSFEPLLRLCVGSWRIFMRIEIIDIRFVTQEPPKLEFYMKFFFGFFYFFFRFFFWFEKIFWPLTFNTMGMAAYFEWWFFCQRRWFSSLTAQIFKNLDLIFAFFAFFLIFNINMSFQFTSQRHLKDDKLQELQFGTRSISD